MIRSDVERMNLGKAVGDGGCEKGKGVSENVDLPRSFSRLRSVFDLLSQSTPSLSDIAISHTLKLKPESLTWKILPSGLYVDTERS